MKYLSVYILTVIIVKTRDILTYIYDNNLDMEARMQKQRLCTSTVDK